MFRDRSGRIRESSAARDFSRGDSAKAAFGACGRAEILRKSRADRAGARERRHAEKIPPNGRFLPGKLHGTHSPTPLLRRKIWQGMQFSVVKARRMRYNIRRANNYTLISRRNFTQALLAAKAATARAFASRAKEGLTRYEYSMHRRRRRQRRLRVFEG